MVEIRPVLKKRVVHTVKKAGRVASTGGAKKIRELGEIWEKKSLNSDVSDGTKI